MYNNAFSRLVHWQMWAPAGDGGGGGGGNVGDGGGGGNNNNPNPNPSPDPNLVTYTKDDLTRLISGRVAAALEGERRRLGAEGIENPVVVSAADKARLDKLAKDAAESERKRLEQEGNYQAALDSKEKSIRQEYEPKLTERDAMIQRLSSRLNTVTVDGAISNAASKHGALNPDQVRFDARITSRVKIDPHTLDPVVYDEDGTTPMFVAGKPATIEQLVKSHLDANPNLVKAPDTGTGGGAGGGRGNTTPSPVADLQRDAEGLRDTYNKTRDLAVLAAFRAKLEALHQKQTELGLPLTRM